MAAQQCAAQHVAQHVVARLVQRVVRVERGKRQSDFIKNETISIPRLVEGLKGLKPVKNWRCAKSVCI